MLSQNTCSGKISSVIKIHIHNIEDIHKDIS